MKRLFFGIETAPSIFQRFMDQILGHMEGVSVFFDDIKIQGASEEECLKCLETVLEILKLNGIKLNKEKCQFLTKSMKYLGFRIDSDGIRNTTEKI